MVRLQELGRNEFSHADGSFHFNRLRPGTYTVAVQRFGYAAVELEVSVVPGEATEVTLRLTPSALSVPGVVVTGVGRVRALDEAYRPTSVLRDEELQRQLAGSVAATLRGEPGIAVRSFGPAPAQPVIRGLSGDRVQILEDGHPIGDLASTGPDHAVGVDPLGAERMEVVRGPAGILYGSNALGGVINVIREEVPRTVPDRLTGVGMFQGESVNRGLSAAGHLSVPMGERFAFRVEGSGRSSGDVQTPLGRLGDTDVVGINASAGVSWIPEWGYLGISGREYRLDHGVPGQFQGKVIPGAHPGGVEAETRRRVARLEGAHRKGLGPFSAVEVEANVVHYTHDEIEARIPTDDGGTRAVVGTRFDQVTSTGRVMALHDHQEGSFRREGALGVSWSWRDLLAGGRFPGSRSGVEANVAVFAYEEFFLSPIRIQLGARYDRSRVDPANRRPIQPGQGEAPVPVTDRSFGDLSGSLAGLLEVRPGVLLGAGLARAFRTPSLKELFSDGPHLADFSFDIGSPDLGSETGLGTDLFLRISRPGIRGEVTVFRNAIRNFIYYAPTGALDPRLRRFPVFRARGTDALFQGVEGRVQWELARGVVTDGTFSYVRATRTEDGDPLPAIPPAQGSLRLRWEPGDLFLELEGEGQAEQRRVPGAIPDPLEPGEMLLPERPTPRSALLHLGAGYRWSRGGGNHSLVLQGRNLGDAVRRDHLSRVKEVAPEAGRSVQVSYRLQF